MTFPIRLLHLCLPSLLLSLSHAALAPSARFFAPDLLAGSYSLQKSLPVPAACPSAIGLAGYANHPAKGVTVEHVQVSVGGRRCAAAGDIVVSNADHAIETQPLARLMEVHATVGSIAKTLVVAGGAFMGVSEKGMRCGERSIPKNAVYAFVNETRRDVELMKGRVVLEKGRRHMVIFLDSVKTPIGTCSRSHRYALPAETAGSSNPSLCSLS